MISLIIQVAGIVFMAGIAWSKFKQQSKDLNGIGKMLREHIDAENRFHSAMTTIILLEQMSEEERNKSMKLINIMLSAGHGRI